MDFFPPPPIIITLSVYPSQGFGAAFGVTV